MKGYIEDEEFGKIIVELRRGMTSVRFSIRPDGLLLMRAPLRASIADLKRMVDSNREALRRLPRPDVPEMYVGQVIECFGCRVVVEATEPRPGYVQTRWEDDVLHVAVHADTDLTDLRTKQFVSDRISYAMEYIAEKILLPYAREVADGVGLTPAGFEVGRGMRKLGHCTTKQVIQLSRNLMFYPKELIRYVVCHELAHLTHMNHSPQFHALCDQYCGGKEKELEQQLRQFRFPIVK